MSLSLGAGKRRLYLYGFPDCLSPPPPPWGLPNRFAGALALTLCLWAVPSRSFAETPEDTGYFLFAETGLHHYIVPDALVGLIDGGAMPEYAGAVSAGLIEPKPGFRIALGGGFRRFRISLESGYTHIAGANPLILDFVFVPLVFRLEYIQPLPLGFGLRAGAGIGVLLSRVIHYRTVLDIFADRKARTLGQSPLVELRFHGTWTLPGKFLTVYAGGGMDCVPETGGPIPLFAWEAGLSFNPVASGRGR